MARSIRLILALTLLVALAAATVATASAGGRKVLDSTMAGLPVPSTVLNGLTGGGAPWQIENGRVLLFADGRLHVEVEGLIIPAQGRNPVPQGKAVVTCGETVAAETALVPFSEAGDAEIDTVVDLPDPCHGVAVFFTNATGRWFAVTGF
ncbi:MAG: hypothetical protein EPO36_02390 [Chloroflexota bacterium]|nr:MAG: hypothetical protein EPO36_02390 [Chloroflexota bacterium]